jgi:NAD(P)-dependent dehydrogenase (short-subunit alcohol dehydrogenase family)
MDNESPVWLITGGSSGLGLLIAQEALRRGATVIATARRVESLRELTDEWGDRVVPLALDMTDSDQVAAAVQYINENCSRLDVLVNNAGRLHFGAVEEVSDRELRSMFDLHVFGPTQLVRGTLPTMRSRRAGTIVQMSSMSAFLINPGFSSYTATKAALEGLSATLAKEVADFGIRVLIVEPGPHRTAVLAPDRLTSAEPMADYAAVLGPVREIVATRDGTQPNDPATAAKLIVDVVLSPNVPVRLPLGGEAIDLIRTELGNIDKNMADWEDVARSTAYDVPA